MNYRHRNNMSTAVSRPESAAGFSPSTIKQVHAPVATLPSGSRNNRRHTHNPPPRKPTDASRAANKTSQRGLRNSASTGKLNNSDQRAAISQEEQQHPDEDTTLSTPTKSGRRGSRGGRQKNKQQPPQQDMSAKNASSDGSKPNKTAKQRARRRQPSPSYLDNGDDVVLLASSPPNMGGANSQQQQQQHTPGRRPSKQQRPASTPNAFGPPQRMGNGDALPLSTSSLPLFGGSPSRVRSPLSASRSNHYAGASFNNSPAPNTLPLPPSFLTSPTKPSNSTSVTRDEDVFGPTAGAVVSSPERLAMGGGSNGHQQMPPPSLALQPPPSFAYHSHAAAPSFGSGSASAALNERSRQLQSMLASNGGTVSYPQHQQHQFYHQNAAAMAGTMHGSHSSVDLTQIGGDMTTMFQKLHLIKEMAGNRPATVAPIANTTQMNHHHQLAPVYNA
ncbi:hypothetical protein GGI11_005645 [Coemansia sp. RSA 2049]|nr:hypothetical protein GGI11_005645 [Coemansia sp. RSA 2049]